MLRTVESVEQLRRLIADAQLLESRLHEHKFTPSALAITEIRRRAARLGDSLEQLLTALEQMITDYEQPRRPDQHEKKTN